ncbi:hypothetical protein [Arthrobacter sp. N199823]|uniref:hypothetical protein n=1 Tax=Arthrobacter sp. N199823 TaxID=2058895 RepID=UPI000CE46C0B|nr:hypothetical protein [Arthrobacter sp. N199823]
MRIVKAHLWDAPVLAWVAAWAFAAEHRREGVYRRAVAVYPMHLLSVLVLMVQGQLWRWDHKALIGIGRPGWRSYLAGGIAALICCAGFLALLICLPGASMGQLKAALVVMGLLLVFLLAAMIAAVGEMNVTRSLANSAAIKGWKKTLPGYSFYKVSYLAMYPQTGEGFTFARAAIEQLVPAGAGIYTEARSEKHRAIYARAGLHPLSTKSGKPTLAMGAVAD